VEFHPKYPTPEHENAAKTITDYFSSHYQVDAVLLVNSCARGKATPDSCLDLAVLVQPELLQHNRTELEVDWEEYLNTNKEIENLNKAGKYSVVHLNFTDGVFIPEERDEAAGPDGFELGIGNLLVYGVPLWQSSHYLEQLKDQWLPFYNEKMRNERLRMVKFYCLNNLHHIPPYLERGLYFQCLDRLYNAYREFLQALFISHRTYPIAYNKWIREQVVEILGLPELYIQLTHLFEVKRFESTVWLEKSKEVEDLVERYASVD
jgi:predicted nucleotidyltransferase